MLNCGGWKGTKMHMLMTQMFKIWYILTFDGCNLHANDMQYIFYRKPMWYALLEMWMGFLRPIRLPEVWILRRKYLGLTLVLRVFTPRRPLLLLLCGCSCSSDPPQSTCLSAACQVLSNIFMPRVCCAPWLLLYNNDSFYALSDKELQADWRHGSLGEDWESVDKNTKRPLC